MLSMFFMVDKKQMNFEVIPRYPKETGLREYVDSTNLARVTVELSGLLSTIKDDAYATSLRKQVSQIQLS
jgi:hypothetical protein